MEVIKHGNTVVEYECGCGCQFLAAKIDRRIEQNMYLHKIRYYVSCPECGRKVENSITEWVNA